jgi:ferredoxin-type protein NapH
MASANSAAIRYTGYGDKMRKLSFNKSLALASGVALFFSVLFLLTERRGVEFLVAKEAYAVFAAVIVFLIFYSGRISGYRSVFFVTSAVSFIIVFKLKLWGLAVPARAALQPGIPEVPFCHIAIASNLFTTLGDQVKAAALFGWDKWGFYTFGSLYVFSTLSVGQGFCSWACFYGGIDEFFSRVFKKQTIKINHIPPRFRDFPLGFWIFLMLASIIFFEPFFCNWICPLKLTTAFLNKGGDMYRIQAVTFIVIAALFLIILPLLVKKRTFCSFLCPFGAFISVAGQVNPYRFMVDSGKCTKCGVCSINCPVFAIDRNFEISNYCVKCGACADKCPESAINVVIKKAGSGGASGYDEKTHVLFILSMMVMGTAISSFFVPEAAVMLLKLAGILR